MMCWLSDLSMCALPTGSHWRRDGTARHVLIPVAIDAQMPVFTPDDIMAGHMPSGHVVVYDDDHYYMGGVMAEKLVEGWLYRDIDHAGNYGIGMDNKHAGTGYNPENASGERR
jgi:hypothetical protein